MSIDAVALLRIPEFEPGDELDVRELDDGFLLYLSLPFASDDDDLLDALDELLGDALDDHDDDRGVFVLPDVADPDESETYEAVLAAVGEAGRFLPLVPAEPLAAHVVDSGMQNMIVEAMQAMGLGTAEDVQRMLSGDQDAMLLAQIRMQRAMEESLAAHGPAAAPTDDPPPGAGSLGPTGAGPEGTSSA